MHSTDSGSPSVPGFLVKLWKIVDDAKSDDLISWNTNGTSFIIHNQARFAKEIVPLYFKHNNMASFVRQLNMYGFRKVSNIEQGGMNTDSDEVEFYHIFFIKDQESLLQHIKRKVPTTKSGDAKQVAVKEMISDVKAIRGKQENIESLLVKMKQENEILWREVAILRQKHIKQQQLVEKILQFLMTFVQPSKTLKRKNPLMILDLRGGKSPHLSVANDSSLSMPMVSGPVIHDVTDFVDDASNERSNLGSSPVHIGNTSSPRSLEDEVSRNCMVDSALNSPLNTNESIEPLSLLDVLQPSVLDITSVAAQEKAVDEIQEESPLLIPSPLHTPLVEVSPLSPLAVSNENDTSNSKSKEQEVKENVKNSIPPSFDICHIRSDLTKALDPVLSALDLTSKDKFLHTREKTVSSSRLSPSLSTFPYVESSSTALSDAAVSSLNTLVTSSVTQTPEASDCNTPANEGSVSLQENGNENAQPSFADLLEAICEPTAPPESLTRNSFSNHLERTESELDWLQEQLLHGELNINSEALLQYFNNDDSSLQQQIPTNNSGFINDSEEPRGQIIGNELTQFTPLLFDLVQDYKEMTETEAANPGDERNGISGTFPVENNEVVAPDEPKVTKTESPISKNNKHVQKQTHLKKSSKSRRKNHC